MDIAEELDGKGRGPPQQGSKYPGRKAFMELHSLFRKEIEKRRTAPAEDIISELVTTTVSGRRLSDIEIINFCNTLLIAGNETTASLIGNMVNLLAERPALWERLRTDRTLVEPVIEESLRYDSPVQFINRKLAAAVTIGGHALEAGATVIACIGAANRDPEMFADADQFDPGRKEKHHLAFSHGIHFCVGAALTRLEARIVLNKLLDRFASIRRIESGTRYANLFFRGFRQLKISASR